jgi:hypothetical protein
MKANGKITTLAGGALVLALVSGAFGEEKTAAQATAAPLKPAALNAGLANDWLREQNQDFAPWDVGGQLRARYEVKEDGGSFPTRDFRKTGVDNDNSYFLLREKIHLGYNSSWFSAYIEARDSSTTGDDREPNPEADQFDLHQAFVTVGNAKQFPLTAKVGRQEMIYGDERLVGNADWNNLGRVFDLAKLRYEDKNLWVDAFSGRVVLANDGHFNVANDYDWFSGIYASTRTLVPKQETQLYFLARNTGAGSPTATTGSPQAGGPSARDIYSFGLRVKSLPGQWQGWDYGAEWVGQLGSVNLGGTRLDHEAFAASVGGGYTWAKAFGSPRVGFEYNFASGDSDPTDGTSETFENLFPTNHKHYGYMDFVGWRNMHNPRFSASLKPAKSLTVTLDYHLFWLADTADFFYPESGAGRSSTGSYGRNPAFDSFAGSELNLDVTYAPKPWFMLRAGYGHFFVGRYVKQSLSGVGGSTDADWVYLQTTVNF